MCTILTSPWERQPQFSVLTATSSASSGSQETRKPPKRLTFPPKLVLLCQKIVSLMCCTKHSPTFHALFSHHSYSRQNIKMLKQILAMTSYKTPALYQPIGVYSHLIFSISHLTFVDFSHPNQQIRMFYSSMLYFILQFPYSTADKSTLNMRRLHSSPLSCFLPGLRGSQKESERAMTLL